MVNTSVNGSGGPKGSPGPSALHITELSGLREFCRTSLAHYRPTRQEGSGLLRQPAFHTAIRVALFTNPETRFPTNVDLIGALESSGLPVSHNGRSVDKVTESSVKSHVKSAKSEILGRMAESATEVYREGFEFEPQVLMKLLAEIDGSAVFKTNFRAYERVLARERLVEAFRFKLSGSLTDGGTSDYLLCHRVAERFLTDLFGLKLPLHDKLVEAFEGFATRFVMMQRFGMEQHFFDNAIESPCSLAEAKSRMRIAREQAACEGRDPNSGRTICLAMPWLYHRLSAAVNDSHRENIAPLIMEVLDVQRGDPRRRNWGIRAVRKEYFEDLLTRVDVNGDPRKLQKSMVDPEAAALASHYMPGTALRERLQMSGEVLVNLLEEFSHVALTELEKEQRIYSQTVIDFGHLALRYYQPSMSLIDYQNVLRCGRHHTLLRLNSLEKEIARSTEPTAEIAVRYAVGNRGIERLRHQLVEAGIPKVGTHVIYDYFNPNGTLELCEIHPRKDMATLLDLGKELHALPLVLQLLGRISGRRPYAIESLKFSDPALSELQAQLKTFIDSYLSVSPELNRERAQQIAHTAEGLSFSPEALNLRAPRRAKEGDGAIRIFISPERVNQVKEICLIICDELDPRHFEPYKGLFAK